MSQNEAIHTAPASGFKQSGDRYYDEQVFPKIVQREKVFNWWAALFGYFWFPYKGLWRAWAQVFMPYAVFATFFWQLKLTIPLLMGSIVLFLVTGFRANEIYFKRIQAGAVSTSNAWAGFGGGLAYALCYTIFVNLWGGFFPLYNQKRMSHTGPSQVKQATPVETADAVKGRMPANSEDQ